MPPGRPAKLGGRTSGRGWRSFTSTLSAPANYARWRPEPAAIEKPLGKLRGIPKAEARAKEARQALFRRIRESEGATVTTVQDAEDIRYELADWKHIPPGQTKDDRLQRAHLIGCDLDEVRKYEEWAAKGVEALSLAETWNAADGKSEVKRYQQ